MGNELNEIEFSLPITLLQNLSTAIKKRQQETFLYRGSKPSPEGAASVCLLLAKIDRVNGKVTFNFESESGILIEKDKKLVKCDVSEFLPEEKNSSSQNEKDEEGEDVPTPVVKRGRGRPPKAVKNTARKSLRVVLEKLDVSTGEIYEVGLSSAEEDEGESDVQSEEEEKKINSTPEIGAIGGRTRTGRVVRKPSKFLDDDDTSNRGVSPKGGRGFIKTEPKDTPGSGRKSMSNRGLGLPPSMSSKTALLHSVQLKPVSNIDKNKPTPETHPHLFKFGTAQLIEKDGQKQILLPSGKKSRSFKGAKSLKKPKSATGVYPTMLIGPGFGEDDDDDDYEDDDDLDDDEVEEVGEEEFMEEEDPDWDPVDDDEAASKKRKASEDFSASLSKSMKFTPGDKTPIGKKFAAETPPSSVTKGRLADVITGRTRLGSQLPKTPLVKIKLNDENRSLWDDHDYLRQRETTSAETHQTRQKSKKGKPEVENEIEKSDDVDTGMDFQATFMKQLAIQTIYNIQQADTKFLQSRDRRPTYKKPGAAQKQVPVDNSQVPRIFRQVTLTSKGRPIRIQDRKTKSAVLAQQHKEQPDGIKAVNDEDDDDSRGKSVETTSVENIVIDDILSTSSMPSQILDETMPSDFDITDSNIEDQSVVDGDTVGQLGGCFLPVDENGNPIQFLDENGDPVSLFDEEGNIRELWNAEGVPIQMVDESGTEIQGIYQQEYSSYDPNLKVESMETYEDYFDADDDVDVSILEIEQECFEDIAIDDSMDAALRPQNNLPCEICFSFFLNNKNLLSHIRSKHRKDPHFAAFEARIIERSKVKCELCEKTMDSDLKLMEHMQMVHDVDAKYKCLVCAKGFLEHGRLIQHEKKVHRDIDQLCHLCPAVFKNPKSLEKHIHMHTSGEWDKLEANRVCPHCKKRFDKTASLQAHIKARHLNPNTSSHSSISRCWTCQAEFSSAKDLRKHMIAEHVLHGHKYHCTLCKKVFDSMDALTKHKTEVHSGGISLHCPFCGIGYMARHTLISHISNNHLNRETPYKCPFCPSKFIRAVFLQKHIGVVHDLVAEVEVRKGSCDDQSEDKSKVKKCIFDNCEKTFMKEKDVVEHILDSHHEHFPFECETCNQRFSKEKYVTSHAHAAHRTKPFLPPKFEPKKEEVVEPSTGKLVQKVNFTPVGSKYVKPIVKTTPKVSVISKTDTTPVPKKTILIDSSGRQISQIHQTPTSQLATVVQPASTIATVTRSPIKVIQASVNTPIQVQGRSLLSKQLVTTPSTTYIQPQPSYETQVQTATQSIQTVEMDEPEDQTVIETVQEVQYPEFIVTTPRGTGEQNVDVEQIVYNLNVDPNPRAWHYSRIEDHAATLTISQEQTVGTSGDSQSSINVVSAEELWRIINENIDS